ncbi:MAG: phosphoribosyltransferase [Alphaproteobacteria bacterium]|nr:phosphoribosyltransferase [Alphaproteobacteria bacterium]
MPVAHHKYLDRRDAGRQLAGLLANWKQSGIVVFALPRGGVPVAVEVAKALGSRLDLLYVRKIGAPLEPELALGAVVDGAEPDIVFNEALVRRSGVSRSVLEEITQRELQEVERRRRRYGGIPLMPTGRPAIIVDDGLATGASMRAAVKALRRRGATRVIVAVPVAPPAAVAELEADGAEVVCPLVTESFFGVGSFYRDFHQLSDADVLSALDELKCVSRRDQPT